MTRHLVSIASLSFAVVMQVAVHGATVFDNFDDDMVDPAKWDADISTHEGYFTETSGRVEFTSTYQTGTGEEGEITYLISQALRPWGTILPADRAWTIEADAHTSHGEIMNFYSNVSTGLFVIPQYLGGETFVETRQVGVGLTSSHNNEDGFSRSISLHDMMSYPFFPGASAESFPAVRFQMTYNPETGRVSVGYAPVGGSEFTSLGSVLISEEGPGYGYDSFKVGLLGASMGLNVGEGTAYVDNFSVSVVPEPSSLALAALGGLIGMRRSRARPAGTAV